MNASRNSTRTVSLSSLSRFVAASAVGLALSNSASAQLLTFSHDDFGESQGHKGWLYGFFDGDSETPWGLLDFEMMPIFDGTRWRREDGVGGYWTSLDRDGGHPNGTLTSGGRTPEVNWPVRRWVAEETYVLRINGRMWDSDPTPEHGNGVTGYIMVDGDIVWQATIENGNIHGATYSLDICTVPGTVIDFAIDPRDGDDLCDSTGFHSTIRTVIETQPQDTLTCTGGAAEFSVVTLPGEFTYQWRHNGVPIEHDATMPRLRVVNASEALTGAYDCVVTSNCGSMVSDPAMLRICDADFDCDGVIDSRDFFTFIDAFFMETPRSDFNHDGMYNTQDFFDFISLFFTGCPV